MSCLSCGNPSDADKVLCDQCSVELDADLDKVLEKASKEKIEATQLEITKDGVLVLISEKLITYIVLSDDEWNSLKSYLADVNFKRGEDEKG